MGNPVYFRTFASRVRSWTPKVLQSTPPNLPNWGQNLVPVLLQFSAKKFQSPTLEFGGGERLPYIRETLSKNYPPLSPGWVKRHSSSSIEGRSPNMASRKEITKWNRVLLEMPGIEPGAFHMQSERATTALHPLTFEWASIAAAVVDKHRCLMREAFAAAIRGKSFSSSSLFCIAGEWQTIAGKCPSPQLLSAVNLTTARQEIDDGINLKYSSRHLKMFDAVILTLSQTCSRNHIPELHFLCYKN